MKHLLLILAFLFTGSLAFSQSGVTKSTMTAEEKAEEATNKLKTELSLTEEQAVKAKEINLEKINKVTDAVKKYGKDKNRLQAANNLIYSEWENKMKGILTEEQVKKFMANKAQYK